MMWLDIAITAFIAFAGGWACCAIWREIQDQ